MRLKCPDEKHSIKTIRELSPELQELQELHIPGTPFTAGWDQHATTGDANWIGFIQQPQSPAGIYFMPGSTGYYGGPYEGIGTWKVLKLNASCGVGVTINNNLFTTQYWKSLYNDITDPYPWYYPHRW